jgi:hypothetical protein
VRGSCGRRWRATATTAPCRSRKAESSPPRRVRPQSEREVRSFRNELESPPWPIRAAARGELRIHLALYARGLGQSRASSACVSG